MATGAMARRVVRTFMSILPSPALGLGFVVPGVRDGRGAPCVLTVAERAARGIPPRSDLSGGEIGPGDDAPFVPAPGLCREPRRDCTPTAIGRAGRRASRAARVRLAGGPRVELGPVRVDELLLEGVADRTRHGVVAELCSAVPVGRGLGDLLLEELSSRRRQAVRVHRTGP